jgi:2-polyprenyl-3-methyl-5-hydroxy-6-metoxy-1,4-benzoquinol methylase
MYICGLNMKNQSTIILFCVIVLATGLACKRMATENEEAQETSGGLTSGDSAGYENTVVQYESADRVIWQKPDLVIKQLGDVEGKVVADLGAGTGYFSRRIAYKGATVIAIDIDPKAIQWMEEQKSRFPVELQDRLVIRLAEPDDPKLKTNEVNIVLLVNTYSYIQNRVPYFSKLKNSIQPGGHVVIIDFKKKETPFGPALEERVDVKTVEQELVSAGYTILATDESSLDYQYIIKAQRN